MLYWTSNSSLQLWRWITKANSVDFQKVVGVAKALILQIFLCLKYSNVILNQCENEMGGRKSIWYFWERRGGVWWHLIENSSNHNPFDPWTHYTLGKTEYIFLETLQINDENEFDLQMSHFIRILLNFLGLHVSNDHFLEILNNLKALNQTSFWTYFEVLVNSYRVFYADQFSFSYLCPKATGLWEFYDFQRSNIALCGAPYSRNHKIYLFCWKVQKNSVNTTLSMEVSSTKSNFVWLLKSKEFFQQYKNVWNYFQNERKLLLDLDFVLQHFSNFFGDFEFRNWVSV